MNLKPGGIIFASLMFLVFEITRRSSSYIKESIGLDDEPEYDNNDENNEVIDGNNKESEEDNGNNSSKNITIFTIVAGLLICIQYFISNNWSHKNETTERINTEQNIDPNFWGETEITPEKAEMVYNKIEKFITRYKSNLPEEIGNDLSIIKCEMLGLEIKYTIQSDKFSHTDIKNDEVIANLDACCEEIKTKIEDDVQINLKDYGYDMVFCFVNKQNQEIYKRDVTGTGE
jgi:hypothetical protein